MKIGFVLKYILAFSFGLFACAVLAHDPLIHRAITVNAAASTLDDSVAYKSFLNVISPDLTMADATNFMIIGSDVEDNKVPPIDEGGNRSVNHFYDPVDTHIYRKGLSDSPPDRRVILATNSFAWGSISNCLGFNYNGALGFIGRNVDKSNIWSWPNARGYEWLGLTATNKAGRFLALTNMFRAIGQVMHLLEDTSQPQHVRNEQHLDITGSPWHSPIEDYGKTHHFELNYQHSMLDWKGDGFTKLEDFWDRHLYNGTSSQPLIDNEDPTKPTSTLGLAEFSNGNFLGARHTYAEFFDKTSIKYYPFPSLKNTTQPQINPYNLLGTAINTATLENGKQGDRVYLSKTSAGITITNHSALHYFVVKHPPKMNTPEMQVGLTINDANVLQEYHSILIPKAVEYSAGLLDYFFRGTLSARIIGYDSVSQTYTNQIVNTYGQDFTNGAFSIYQDDTNGTRTLLTNLDFSGQTLLRGNSTIMTFPNPATNKLLLVYRGTMGPDPVDAGIGIAAGMFLVQTSAPPIASWTAEGNANDVIGGHHGTLENTGFTTGKIGFAFAFDPANHPAPARVSVRVPDSPDFILTNTLSIEGWVRLRGNAQGYGQIIFYRGDNRAGDDPYYLGMESDNTVVFQIEAEDNSAANVKTTLASNQWSHVAATLDSGLMKLYVNGVLMGQTNTTVRPFAELDPGLDPGIGIGNTHEEATSFPFYGDVDQISLYGRALSADEIEAIYLAGLAGENYY